MNHCRSRFSSAQKDLSLEALRGLAAFAVLAWHLLIAFAPELVLTRDKGFIGSPFYGFFHGTAAANVFFLLTGYVLTQRYFQTHDNGILIVGALKRWFRLLPLPLITVLFSWALYHFNLYSYQEAASVTLSNWLMSSGGVSPVPVQASLGDALWQGTVGVFFFGKFSFNSNLWTLYYEMYGSLFSFAFAALIIRFRDQHHIVALFSCLCGAALYVIQPCYELFLAGTLLAAYSSYFPRLNKLVAFGCIVVGIYCLGYRSPVGAYALMRPFAFADQVTVYFFTSIVGGSLILVALTACESFNRALQNPVSQFLGFVSFPLYLVHVILICSLGSHAFVSWLSYSYLLAPAIASFTVVAAVLPLSVLLAFFDRRWVRSLNRTAAVLSLFVKTRLARVSALS